MRAESTIMKLSDFTSFHIIGICGAGCAPLARILKRKGFSVSGSDLLDGGAAQSLREEGISVSIGHDAAHLPKADRLLVVRTSAADRSNPEIREAERRGVPCLRRGEVLALLAGEYSFPISISGSHGKTSISASLAYLLDVLGLKPGIMIGGNVKGWEKNGAPGDGTFFVTEADESDGTHALLTSGLGVVPNVDDDHAWSVGGRAQLERNFQTFARKSERLLYVASDATDRLFQGHPNAVRLSEEPPSDFLAGRGHFQRLDAWIAVRAAELLGIEKEKAAAAIESFPGVDRRLSLRHAGYAMIVEDYAHHPAELRESLRSLRELHPGKRLVVAFQPHRHARLERYFDEFAKELAAADRLYVLPVFAAWTASGGRSSRELAEASGGIALSGSWDEIADAIASDLRKNDLIAVVGAGDSVQLPPLLTRRLEALEEKSF